jgi:putative spermidine/putrescine transport system ATP-binding protein
MAPVNLITLSKHYGSFAAVDDVSLDVSDGEFLVLLGPSGCGKTTTLRIVAGFIEPTSGAVRIGSKDVTGEPPYRRNIGLVFQNYALFPHLSVFENVAFGLRRRKVEESELKKRVMNALELVKLAGHIDRMPRQLSGGQQQRVAIARALAVEPDVLLLDEPLSNLDAKLRHDVRQELRRLQQTLGITTIMVTHDQDEAMSVGDRLVVMNQGRVQQIGSPEDLYHTPANRFVASFIGRANFLPGHVAGDGRHFVTDSGLTIISRHLSSNADTLMIRPEMISVHRSPVQGENVVQATVEAATFLGSSYELDLKTQGGDPLIVQLPAQLAGSGGWSIGQEISVSIDPEVAIGIRESGGSPVEAAGATNGRTSMSAA